MFRQRKKQKFVFLVLLIPSSFSWRDVSCCMQQLVRSFVLLPTIASSAAVILVCCSNTVLLCRLAILENCAQAATSWERKWMMMISSLTRALSYNSEHGWHCSHHQLRPTLYAMSLMSYRADLILDILNLQHTTPGIQHPNLQVRIWQIIIFYFLALCRSCTMQNEYTYLQPDILWSDGEAGSDVAYWKSLEFLAWLYTSSPVSKNVVTNDRQTGKTY